MRRLGRVFICLVASAAVATVGPVSAASPSSTDSHSVVIDGRKFGPKDGLQIDTYRIELTSGSSDEVGMIFTDAPSTGGVSPMVTWGSSYAITTEDWQWWYHGRAKAAANVYDGKRIIQVCIWYTRGADRISPKVCSNATDNSGYWVAGPEKTTECTDTIDPFAPPTVFNISTARIDPLIT
jgi:hypothetical protein